MPKWSVEKNSKGFWWLMVLIIPCFTYSPVSLLYWTENQNQAQYSRCDHKYQIWRNRHFFWFAYYAFFASTSYYAICFLSFTFVLLTDRCQTYDPRTSIIFLLWNLFLSSQFQTIQLNADNLLEVQDFQLPFIKLHEFLSAQFSSLSEYR